MVHEKGRLIHVLKLSAYIKAYRGYSLFSIFMIGIHQLIPILSTGLLSYLIGLLAAGKTLQQMKTHMIVFAALVIFQGLISYLDTWISHDIAYRILAKLRIALYEKIEQISPSYLQGNRSGQISAILLHDVEILEWFYAHTFGLAIVAILMALGGAIFFFMLDVRLGFLILPFLGLALLLPIFFKKKSDYQGVLVRERLAELEADMVEGVHGIKDIISFGWQNDFRERFYRHNHDYEEARLKDGKRRGIEGAISKILMASAMFLVLLLSSYLVYEGALKIEWYPVAVALSGAVFVPMMAFLNMSSQFGLIFSSAARVFQVLSTPAPVKDEGKETLSITDEVSLCFQHLSFTYPGQEKKALDDISFTIHKGEKVAIAGASGAGKSTLTHLIQRFWPYEEGEILINHRPITDYTLHSLRAQLAMVPQDVYLFNTSIMENFQISRADVTPEEVVAVAQKVGAHEFIAALPKGYETRVGEGGSRFSGGQKQRLSVGRALLKAAKIILLDEASSNLDGENEEKIDAVLEEMKADKVILIIAHRIATLKKADRIIFLHEGKIEDEGSFETLASRNRLFCEVMGIEKEADHHAS